MPGKGPAPKKTAHRRARKTQLASVTSLPATQDDRDFTPPKLPSADKYCPGTQAWYDALAALPQASKWGPGNWLLIHQTAPIACAFYCGDLRQAAELRIRQSKLEVSDDDLRRAANTSTPAPPQPRSPAHKLAAGGTRPQPTKRGPDPRLTRGR